MEQHKENLKKYFEDSEEIKKDIIRVLEEIKYESKWFSKP